MFSIISIQYTGDSPVVWYGTSKDKLSMQADATTKTYKREDMCAFPANSIVAFRDPGLIHDALLTGLQPGVTYYYSFGSAKV